MTDGRTEERDEAIAAMEQRGIDGAEQLLELAPPATVLAWCRWWDSQPGASKRVLAAKIRSGESPPQSRRERDDSQHAYGQQIAAWLCEEMPQVCKPNPRVVEWHRRVFGDVEADRLAGDQSPHPAAVACVIRLHQRVGKGRVTRREHGAEILNCVKAFDRQAIADYEQIAARREAAAT